VVVDVVIEPFVNVVNFAFDSQENLLVLRVLFGVPLVEPGQAPHQGTANDGDNNRYPPIHGLHPTVPDRLGLDAGVCGLLFLLALALADSRAMKVFFAMGKSQANATQMALKADGTSTWKHVEGEKIATFHTVN
jgi:hypothetical protein